ncbi:MAG: thioredoxin family protein [SAR324 cluster bacterium]|nr:thioredoxin family protein [SAR324 cluster bacterium]
MTELLENGWVVVVKHDCPTCELVQPVLRKMEDSGTPLQVFSQDDPSFPEGLATVVDDRDLEQSFRLEIESVPTLIRRENGQEVERTVGWHRGEWWELTGIAGLGEELPELQPGCGSLSVEPGMAERLQVRFGEVPFQSRQISLSENEDPIEVAYDRGWSDGFPVVPPTDERILRMLEGTSRPWHEVIGKMPPNLVDCTVEKVAINAVMAGCRPEYLPVVLGALEAALVPKFTLHGLMATTWFSTPVIIVNGPIAKRIGMNSGLNALGQGNRANATIGRAVNLVLRNVGGVVPGGIDRSTLGAPSKYSFCFAEDESDESWTSLAESRGVAPGKSAVTLFQGEGVQGFADQRSRTAEKLSRSLALGLQAVTHPKIVQNANALLVLSPEHYAIFQESGWGRAEIDEHLMKDLTRPGHELVQGAQGVSEGIDPSRANEAVSKFWPQGLLIVRAGGRAGLFSAICGGWIAGRDPDELQPITHPISE